MLVDQNSVGGGACLRDAKRCRRFKKKKWLDVVTMRNGFSFTLNVFFFLRRVFSFANGSITLLENGMEPEGRLRRLAPHLFNPMPSLKLTVQKVPMKI